MSINLGTYALVSALAVGGVVAQQQYSKPAGPPADEATQQSMQPNQGSYSGTPMGPTTGVMDCDTLMTHHQQMRTELDQLDAQANALVTQMKEAKSDRARLDATIGVVEALVTQRKQIRDRMSMMEHATLQFVFANHDTDLDKSCPQLTELLQKGMMPHTTDEGGPDDLEFDPNDNNQR
jgi:hypothetical protein